MHSKLRVILLSIEARDASVLLNLATAKADRSFPNDLLFSTEGMRSKFRGQHVRVMSITVMIEPIQIFSVHWIFS